MREHQTGELLGFLKHDEIGEIDLPWGHYDPVTENGAGLAKLVAKHPEVVDDLPQIVAGMKVIKKVETE